MEAAIVLSWARLPVAFFSDTFLTPPMETVSTVKRAHALYFWYTNSCDLAQPLKESQGLLMFCEPLFENLCSPKEGGACES